MAGKGKKRRGGFWSWLTGRQPADHAEPAEDAGGDDQATAPAPDRAAAAPAESDRGGEPTCALCGGSSFSWGWLESGLYGMGKGPAAAAQPKYVKQKTRFGDFLGLRARVCDNCGHVELFSLPEDEA